MSSVVIAGDTSGSITVSAPAVAGSNTLTLPAATGTVIYANASGNLQANSGYGSVATGYLCRAWVNFNGQGTIAIRSSGNVTSITDGGTGVYTVNFTTSMPDANYTYNCSGYAATNAYNVIQGFAPDGVTASSLKLASVTQSGGAPTAYDPAIVSVSVIR